MGLGKQDRPPTSLSETEFPGIRNLTPEERLWFYVLLDAVERWRENQRDAYTWLFLGDRGEIGSFSWVCHVLEIDMVGLIEKLEASRRGLDFKGRCVSGMVKDM